VARKEGLCPLIGGLDGPALRLHLMVGQQPLGIGLWQAELREVFARLRQEAALIILGSLCAAIRVRAEIGDLVLEQGLRRLLRLTFLWKA
jgi:hypothetical protein